MAGKAGFLMCTVCAVAFAACSGGPAPRKDLQVVSSGFAPKYLGIETHLLDGDLVNFQVEMTGARDRRDVTRYADCAAAQYTLIRGFGFARHVRTNVAEQSGTWLGDAVYVISPSLPDGVNQLDAEVVAQDCAENGIPMV
ncbi:MAG: hypothetical protein AAFZ10_12035 [Pseudomonadota bacterium]